MMQQFDDMSRDELLKAAKSMWDQMIYSGNHLNAIHCPFCGGSGVVSFVKCQVKDSVIQEWNRDFTREEYEAHIDELMNKFPPPKASDV